MSITGTSTAAATASSTAARTGVWYDMTSTRPEALTAPKFRVIEGTMFLDYESDPQPHRVARRSDASMEIL